MAGSSLETQRRDLYANTPDACAPQAETATSPAAQDCLSLPVVYFSFHEQPQHHRAEGTFRSEDGWQSETNPPVHRSITARAAPYDWLSRVRPRDPARHFIR